MRKVSRITIKIAQVDKIFNDNCQLATVIIELKTS